MAQRPNLEELFCLRFNAFRAVDNHYGGVGSHERTVRVFGKVLVTRGVKDIDTLSAVGELKYRRGHGNAALFFDVHPVAGCLAGPAFAFYRACRLNGARIQQQFLGKRCFARVGVADNGERAP